MTMDKNEYVRFGRAVAKLKEECWERRGLFIKKLGDGWEITVTEQGLDRRWTVRHNGRKVAATFKLRPTLLDIRDRGDMSYANALFHALGMDDRVRMSKGEFRWVHRGEETMLTPEFCIEELPPTPPVSVWTDDGWRDAREVR